MFKLKNKIFKELKAKADEEGKKEAEAAALAAAKAPKGKAPAKGAKPDTRADVKSGGSKRGSNPDDELLKKAEEEAINVLKTKSADEEDKDWVFPHMDKINSELHS